jgi:hypothetical protein
VLFTWGQLKNIQVSLDDRNDVKRKLENTRTELTKLNDIEHKLKSSEIDLKQYVNTLTEDKIIDYIY